MLGTLSLLLCLAQGSSTPLTLEIRVFLGAEEVSAETRAALHRAGDRTAAVAQAHGRDGRLVFSVPAGIYDVQVVREREGRVFNIRWAERLVVMPYPDEGGKHLEVVNFTNGYGALQIKSSGPGTLPDVAVFAVGERTRPAGTAVPDRGSDSYALFVLPAAHYDIQVRSGARPAWHPDMEVPLDRTRLWLVPENP